MNSGPRQHVCSWLGDTQGKATAVHPWHGPLGAQGSHPAHPLDPVTVASWSSMRNVLGGRGQLQNNTCFREVQRCSKGGKISSESLGGKKPTKSIQRQRIQHLSLINFRFFGI